jgi:hypothetical protein
MASQVSEISRELVSHLQGIYGANINVSLEIEVDVPDGIPSDRQEAVTRTSESLRFDQSDFAGD